MNSNITTFANCIKIKKKDEKIITITDHVESIEKEGDVYYPGILKDFDKISKTSYLEQDEFFIYCILENNFFNIKDIELGYFFLSEITFLSVDYQKPESSFHIKTGYIKDIKLINKNNLVISVVSFSYLLTHNINSKFSTKCRAIFGDNNCSIELEEYTFRGMVTKEINDYEFIDSSRTEEIGYFDYGKIKFISGSNVNMEYKVERYIDGKISIFTKAIEKITLFSEYTIIAGCDKCFLTCEKKFENLKNFRGEPYLVNN